MIAPGFQRISAEDYHADKVAPEPSLSCSIIKTLLSESPRKAWYLHPRLNPAHIEDQDNKYDRGTSAHAALLENGLDKIVVVGADDWRTKEAKAAREAARAIGRTALLAHHFKDVKEMVIAARQFIAESELCLEWRGGDSELTGVWQEGPLWMRCRFDRISKDRRVIMDYKSTTDAAPEAFSKQIARMGYHIQDSFYRRGARALGVDEPKFFFLAQSCEPPYECTWHACHPGLQEIADAQVEMAINVWHQCITQNQWPSYGGQVHYAMPTSYMLTEHETRLAETA